MKKRFMKNVVNYSVFGMRKKRKIANFQRPLLRN